MNKKMIYSKRMKHQKVFKEKIFTDVLTRLWVELNTKTVISDVFKQL
jgi:hypothetical protein